MIRVLALFTILLAAGCLDGASPGTPSPSTHLPPSSSFESVTTTSSGGPILGQRFVDLEFATARPGNLTFKLVLNLDGDSCDVSLAAATARPPVGVGAILAFEAGQQYVRLWNAASGTFRAHAGALDFSTGDSGGRTGTSSIEVNGVSGLATILFAGQLAVVPGNEKTGPDALVLKVECGTGGRLVSLEASGQYQLDNDWTLEQGVGVQSSAGTGISGQVTASLTCETESMLGFAWLAGTGNALRIQVSHPAGAEEWLLSWPGVATNSSFGSSGGTVTYSLDSGHGPFGSFVLGTLCVSPVAMGLKGLDDIRP